MAGDLADLLVTSCVALAGSLGATALTLRASNRRDQRLAAQARLDRNLDLRRAAAAEFVQALGEVSRLAARGDAARSEYRDSARRATQIDDLPRRLAVARTNLLLLCGPETQLTLDQAASQAEETVQYLSGRSTGQAGLDELAAALEHHVRMAVRVLQADLGESA